MLYQASKKLRNQHESDDIPNNSRACQGVIFDNDEDVAWKYSRFCGWGLIYLDQHQMGEESTREYQATALNARRLSAPMLYIENSAELRLSARCATRSP